MERKRFRIKHGDIFEVFTISGKRYFQYLIQDEIQLNSQVIAVFKNIYSNNDTPRIDQIVNDNVDFYVHTFIKAGIDLLDWKKIGNSNFIVDFSTVVFVSTNDFNTDNCQDWWIWQVGDKDQKYVGKLIKDQKYSYENGIVINPRSIVNRMESGSFLGVFPKF